jgi:hypothetical protein
MILWAIIKKIWGGILHAVFWLTQDSPRLHDAKHKTNVEHEAIVQQWRFNNRRW